MRLSIVLAAAFVSCVAPHEPLPPTLEPDAGPPRPARTCRSGRAWSPGRPALVEHTGDWGLEGKNVRSFSVADVDRDGWADLVTALPAYGRGVGRVFFNRPREGGRTFVEDKDGLGLFATRDGDSQGRYFTLATFGDVDNDGDADAFLHLMDSPPAGMTRVADGPDVMLAGADGRFAPTAVPQILGPARPLAVGSFFFDYDLDGALDLATGYWWEPPPFTVPFGQQPQVFKGDGAGGFADVTKSQGLELQGSYAAIAAGTHIRPLFGITPCDVDGDGRVDIVGSAYGRMFNELFIHDGTRFSEQARARGVASDDRTDYRDDQSYRCYCRGRSTDPYCAGAATPYDVRYCSAFGIANGRGWYPGQSDQPWSLGGNTFTHVCEDFDNDGDFDLYESNIRHPDVGSASDPSELLVNDGTGHFTRPGRETMGLVPPVDLSRIDEGGQQAAAWDFDGDGHIDVALMGSPYPGNRGWLFHQKPTGTLQFEYVGQSAGYDPPCPSGAAIADFDHDGDEDVVTGTYGCNGPGGDFVGEQQPSHVYENVSSDTNWVSIKLVGQGGSGHANRSGLGARVRVTAGGVTQTRGVYGSWGQGAMSREQVAFFGLGEACDIERIEVRWPNGELTTQVFTGVVANQRVELREGDAEAHYLP